MKRPKHQDFVRNLSSTPESPGAEKSRLKNSSGIEVEGVYGGDPRPGSFPYTRGPYPTMYRGKRWTMRQYSGFGSAKETNQRFHYLLRNGQTGVSCAFDLPTQMGYDSDDPMAEGEVGRVGVAISHIDDMKILLQKLPLEEISSSMTINSTATTLLSLYLATAESKAVPTQRLRGTIQNDILKEYIARGTYIYPPDFSLALTADSFRFAAKHCPKWNPISISGYHIREAGSTAAQEVAFTLLNAFTYVKTALEAGLKAEDFVSRLSFFFNVHNDFFEEVAKFRIARKIYAEEMQRRFDLDPKLLALRFHAQVAGSTLTAQQPLNNIVRVAYQALAAVLGGTQSLHTNAYDEALGLPTETSALIALRTQQILAEETGVDRVADPLGGSDYLESLCEGMEQKVFEIFKSVEDRGGMLRCIESGFVQSEIQKAAFLAQKAIDSGNQKIVGVNAYLSEAEMEPELHQLDERVVKDQLKRLKSFKSKRKSKSLERAFKALEKEALSLHKGEPATVTEKILACVKERATLGEISNIFRSVAGRHQAL
ncbi:MAG: methylmalonyl-CoA mutase [Bradymonadales bacterium]|nr:MAG: methylmalonyl-CoA mutase [Bradymonadales bacterium]